MVLYEDAFENVRKYIFVNDSAIASNLGVDYVFLMPAPWSDMIRVAVVLNGRTRHDDIKLSDIVMYDSRRQLDFVFSKLRWLAVKACSAGESPFVPFNSTDSTTWGHPSLLEEQRQQASRSASLARQAIQEAQIEPLIGSPTFEQIDAMMSAVAAMPIDERLDAMMGVFGLPARLAPAPVSDVPEEPKFANRFEAVVAEMEDDE